MVNRVHQHLDDLRQCYFAFKQRDSLTTYQLVNEPCSSNFANSIISSAVTGNTSQSVPQSETDLSTSVLTSELDIQEQSTSGLQSVVKKESNSDSDIGS